MAELTVLEEKLAEVIGLAMAAQGATEKIGGLTDDGELSEKLERMKEEARETEERGTELAGELDGKKTALPTRSTASSSCSWPRGALPIQERRFEEVKAGSIKLAAEEDPAEPA
jgi:hypothetical protein